VDGDRHLSIGQVARLVGLSTKALRHYDRLGLFEPDVVDGSGYRWYSPGQLPTARLMGALRAVDLPLQAVRDVLAVPDGATFTAALAQHRRRLEARRTRITGELHEILHLLDDGLDITMSETTASTTATAGPEGFADERALAVRLFNGVWELLGRPERTTADDDTMLHMAHASRFHWGRVGGPEHLARGEWQCSRVYAVLLRGEPSLHHAQRVLDICRENGIGDWDLAFGYEALARAHAVAGDAESARAVTEQALAAAEDIEEPEDRSMVLADLETIPGQPRFW